MHYHIYNLNFLKKIKEILIKMPLPLLVIQEDSLPELTNYFKELANFLHNKYSYLINEKDSTILKNNIELLSFEDKIDICIFFKIKSHFNSKLTPSIRNFCSTLGINKNQTLDKLIKTLLNTPKLSSDKLKFSLKIPCVNCDKLINVDVEYLGSSNYSIPLISCPNCNHEFFFEINDSQREVCGRNLYSIRFVHMTYCLCKVCQKWRNSLVEHICSNIDNFEIELFDYIYKEIFNNFNNKLSLEQLYKIHKNSLTKTENELLNLNPTNFNDMNILIDEMNSRYTKKISKDKIISNLLNHGVIYKKINDKLLKEYITEYTKNFRLLVDLIKSNKISELCYGTMGLNVMDIPPPYSIDYADCSTHLKKYCDINICSIYINTDCVTEYHMNQFYFNNNIDLNPSIKKYKIFNSLAEQTLFHHLSRQYSDYIICINVSLITFIDIDDLISFFAPSEINYLKFCIIDFVIADSDGFIVKCIELQKGTHHNDKDWIYKDALKKKCFSILGIDFSYEY